MTNISDQKARSDIANRAALGKDIRAKWDKFSEIEVGALKSEGDLASQLVAKYAFDKPKAESEAKALVSGRQFRA
jgi:hypothetical protein